MASNTGNTIISIIVLLIGVQVVVYLAKGYIPDSEFVPKDLFASVEGLSNLITLGLIIILLFALPFYFSQRGKDKEKPKNEIQPRQ